MCRRTSPAPPWPWRRWSPTHKTATSPTGSSPIWPISRASLPSRPWCSTRPNRGRGRGRGGGRHDARTCRARRALVSRHRSSVGLRWPSKRIAALHRLPIQLGMGKRCALRYAPTAARSLRHLIGDATLAHQPRPDPVAQFHGFEATDLVGPEALAHFVAGIHAGVGTQSGIHELVRTPDGIVVASEVGGDGNVLWS